MKNRSGLLLWASLLAASMLSAWSRPAAAYIDFPPPTLGALCGKADHIYVLQVQKVSAEKGVILFKCVEQLKGKPDPTAAKHVIGSKVDGAKIILDWATGATGATEKKTAIFFTITGTGQTPGGFGTGCGHAYIDNYWYSLNYDSNGKCWVAFKSELSLLTRYCGTPDNLKTAVAEILKGNEVVVPCLVNDKKEDVQNRTAKVHRLRASLKLKNYNAKRDFVGWGAEEEK